VGKFQSKRERKREQRGDKERWQTERGGETETSEELENGLVGQVQG